MFKVTNNNDFDFTGRCNGQDYLFPKGQSVYCDDAPCEHIFALGKADKAPTLARHGWAGVTSALSAGMAILNAFTFEHMSPVYDAPLALVDANTDYGPAPVDQDAPAEGGTDGSTDAGAVEVAAKRGRPPAAAAA